MSDHLKSNIKRLQRLLQVRQMVAGVAEANVRETENQLQNLNHAQEEILGKIQMTRAEIAYSTTMSGEEVAIGEKRIQALHLRHKSIQQAVENARGKLEHRRREWVEARREQKIVEKIRERRLLEWERTEEVSKQKSVDDASIGRFIRSRPNR